MKREKILVVDDDPDILYAMRITLEKNGYALVDASTGKQGIEAFAREKPDVVFLDITMPDISGLEVMKKLREEADVPVIVMTGYGTMDTAIRAVQLGAYEYMTKPLDADRLRLLVRRALETTQLKREIAGLRLAPDTTFQARTLIGNSAAMQQVYKTIGAVTTTPNSTTVLVQGESGTGKELVARIIHYNGPNASESFVVVNCTVLPPDLLESELFGHEKGAFTGASERKIGKLELAGNGTIFFDEISELSLKLQAKLLRLLQEREFERVGGNEVMKVNARFIVATNRNLEEAMRQGQFREDLFYRINVLALHLPPLRERKEDLPLLMDHFVAKYNAKLGRNIKAIGPQVMKGFTAYHFPGNVRELENIIERAMIISKGDVLTADTLGEILASVDTSPPTIELPITTFDLRKARQEILEEFEKQFLQKLLAETGGNISEAAKLANIQRQSFHRMLKRHKMNTDRFHN